MPHVSTQCFHEADPRHSLPVCAPQEIEAMKKRVKEMEDEAKKIEDMQNNVEKSLKPKP
jgi:hypothetical protein